MDLDEALEYAKDQGVSDRQLAAVVKAAADDVRYRREDGLLSLTHKITGGVIRVHPDAVEQHKKAGWELTGDFYEDDEAAADVHAAFQKNRTAATTVTLEHKEK